MSSASQYHADLLAPYHRLDQGNSIQAECMRCSLHRPVSPPHLVLLSLLDVWIGGNNELRSKSKVGISPTTLLIPLIFNVIIPFQTITQKVTDLSQLPNWDFDGSSTNQAPGHDSDVYLRPAAFYKDPFRGGDNILVLASTYNSDGTPNRTNFRHNAAKTMELAKSSVPWFGLEQEYTLFGMDDRPLGWPAGGFPGPQGPYYCGAGKISCPVLVKYDNSSFVI
jgi:glutamine synthetase